MQNLKCEGHAEGGKFCRGEVKTVIVSGLVLSFPLEFDYCEAAIEEDRANGYTVKVKTEQKKRQRK